MHPHPRLSMSPFGPELFPSSTYIIWIKSRSAPARPLYFWQPLLVGHTHSGIQFAACIRKSASSLFVWVRRACPGLGGEGWQHVWKGRVQASSLWPCELHSCTLSRQVAVWLHSTLESCSWLVCGLWLCLHALTLSCWREAPAD